LLTICVAAPSHLHLIRIPTTRSLPLSQLSYNFYGTHKLDQRCRQFFDQAQDQFLVWPEFKHETDERLICARDGIEQYIMSRIAEYAYKSSLDGEGDDLLSKRMKLLRFLKPEVSSVCVLKLLHALSSEPTLLIYPHPCNHRPWRSSRSCSTRRCWRSRPRSCAKSTPARRLETKSPAW